jgi:hypothetical protein
MSIALTTPLSHPSDPTCDILFIGANYRQQQVLVRVIYDPSGQTKDYVFGPGGIEPLPALVAAIPNFAGLKTSMLQHLQTLDPSLAGSVT